MPNWCSNTITISHSDPEKLNALAEAMQRGEFLDHVIPVHPDLKITAGVKGNEEEQTHLEILQEANLEKYGYSNWYDFCVNRWGTKWEVQCENIENNNGIVSACFDSAWAPPLGIYQQLVDDGYTVCAYYLEEGMGFVGKWHNGIDDYYEYGGYSSKTIREYIGSDIDDHWDLSARIEEYEEWDNQE